MRFIFVILSKAKNTKSFIIGVKEILHHFVPQNDSAIVDRADFSAH